MLIFLVLVTLYYAWVLCLIQGVLISCLCDLLPPCLFHISVLFTVPWIICSLHGIYIPFPLFFFLFVLLMMLHKSRGCVGSITRHQCYIMYIYVHHNLPVEHELISLIKMVSRNQVWSLNG